MQETNIGWSGKILRVDLASGKINTEPTETYAKDFLGGRGINSWILFKETTQDTKPFHPENRLIFGTGPLVGTLVPAACRCTITTLNPLSGGHGDSNFGGHFSAELKFAGYDHVIFQGKAENLVYLWIDDDKIEIRDAGNLRGKSTFETDRLIKQEIGDLDIQTACIGPAGENLVPFASVHATSATRASARCGMGAVMGSKNLKAVAVRGTGSVRVAEPERLFHIIDEIYSTVAESPFLKTRGEKGVLAGLDGYSQMGLIPIRNFQDYHFEEANKIGVDGFLPYLKGHASCFACPTHCDKYYRIDDGMPWGGTWTYDIELSPSLFFAELLIADVNAVIKGFNLLNSYGMDEYDTFYAIAWAIECYERGILTKNDTDGLELRWGDSLLVLELIRRIAYKEGNLGRLLAKGVAKASREMGKGSDKYAMQMKGMAADDAKYPIGWGLGVCVSTSGPSHLKGALVSELRTLTPEEAKKFYGSEYACNPRAYEDKPKLVFECERLRAITDCCEICSFMSLHAYPGLPGLNEIAKFLSVVTGETWTLEDLTIVAERIINVEKAINSRAGLTRKDDYPPERMFEAIPSGPAKGQYLDFSKFERMLDEYYELHGWEKESGLPTGEKLESLGLGEVAEKLEKWGKMLANHAQDVAKEGGSSMSRGGLEPPTG
ncbi:aldehyde ferredoxin oxidoreductase family protein [Chloroflexota bacterium]